MTPPERIVRGQRVKPDKLALAKELRRKMTPQENTLWARLRANRLAGLHFRRQQVIDRFVVDFYCHQAGVIVELDGPVHLGQARYDEARSDWLARRGLRVLRFTNAEVEADLEAVLAKIREVCG